MSPTGQTASDQSEGTSQRPSTMKESSDNNTYHTGDGECSNRTTTSSWVKEQKQKHFSFGRWLRWISKWLFAALLSIVMLGCLIASRLSFVSMSVFYNADNATKDSCIDPRPPLNNTSKETTLIVMLLVIMIPQFISLARCIWLELRNRHRLPTTMEILTCIFVALLEVVGLCFFVIVVLLHSAIDPVNCIAVMNCVFMFPVGIEAAFSLINKEVEKHRSITVILALVLELAAIGVLLAYIIVKEGIPPTVFAFLMCVSFAWSSIVQKCQFDVKTKSTKTNNDAENRRVEESTGHVEIGGDCGKKRKSNAVRRPKRTTSRGISAIISGFAKLILTPCVSALLIYLYDIVELQNLVNGLYLLTADNRLFAYFMVQVFTSLAAAVLGWAVCAMDIQKFAFVLPLYLTTPICVIIMYIPYLCCNHVLPFKAGNQEDFIYIIPIVACLWLGQILFSGFSLCRRQTLLMANESVLFQFPFYNGVLLEQNLILNRKNKTDERPSKYEDKKLWVFVCTTMYHETRYEMQGLLQSLYNLYRNKNTTRGEPNTYAFHIFVDDGIVSGNTLNDNALRLISVIPEVFKVDSEYQDCEQIHGTPYGNQLRWHLDGGIVLYIHLKDSQKTKKKKRWSQVMYMSYVLSEIDHNPDMTLDNTYILATDGDVKFTHESVQALLDMMRKSSTIGAVCGRTHPTGTGPVVWYQVFDYAIGHWFQKVTNHVLGSVLCSPGCFSVYRARAICTVLDEYKTTVETPLDFLKKDMGEDRWLCMLMIKKGWKLEYCAAAKDTTYCPEAFDEFFKQRRRWIQSYITNILGLIGNSWTVVRNNDAISYVFIVYQALLLLSSLISPSTILMVIIGSVRYVTLEVISEGVVLAVLSALSLGFVLICLFTSPNVQLKVAKVLAVLFAIVMAFVAAGMLKAMTTDIMNRAACYGQKPSSSSSVPSDCQDYLPVHIFTLSIATLVAMFILAAIMHPSEFICLFYGLVYFFALPGGYLLLIIYSIVNISDRTWGTRDKKPEIKKPWYSKLCTDIQICCYYGNCCARGVNISENDRHKEDSHQVQFQGISAPVNVDSTATYSGHRYDGYYATIEKILNQNNKQHSQTPPTLGNEIFWKDLVKDTLKPDPSLVDNGKMTSLKKKLKNMRNIVLAIFVLMNAIWMAFIIVIDKMASVELLDFVFVSAFGVVMIVQFLSLSWHRLNTFCYIVARTGSPMNTGRQDKHVVNIQSFVNDTYDSRMDGKNTDLAPVCIHVNDNAVNHADSNEGEPIYENPDEQLDHDEDMNYEQLTSAGIDYENPDTEFTSQETFDNKQPVQPHSETANDYDNPTELLNVHTDIDGCNSGNNDKGDVSSRL